MKKPVFAFLIGTFPYRFISFTYNVFHKPKFIYQVRTDVVKLRNASVFHRKTHLYWKKL